MDNKKNNILIIDDDARNIFALLATLKSRGYNCITASGAQEALRLLDAHHDIGIVLIDMMMPDMDGYEAIPLIKDKNTQGKIPIIAVTAQAMSGDREKCLQAGADDYLSKPVNVDKLFEILHKYLK